MNSLNLELLSTAELMDALSNMEIAEIVNNFKTARQKFERKSANFIVFEEIAMLFLKLNQIEEAVLHYEWFIEGIDSELSE